jgi:hypothetical protein
MPHQKAAAKASRSQRRRHDALLRKNPFFQESHMGERRMAMALMIGYSD